MRNSASCSCLLCVRERPRTSWGRKRKPSASIIGDISDSSDALSNCINKSTTPSFLLVATAQPDTPGQSARVPPVEWLEHADPKRAYCVLSGYLGLLVKWIFSLIEHNVFARVLSKKHVKRLLLTVGERLSPVTVLEWTRA